ncbi:heavy-metal-associated domain-containing protein [Methylomonas rapida]|uniref:Heavy-metal-associated domain-containing protein n=1 Tax=Methylomonas rapida TaxID=2963939 RepID=A0ABY7GG62_9GAMM|nr:heavy-metal-associated domain-containing protein [Methylomonas rapida]WAR43476.1 heavy-metal-associated domain-containing protein [Methylomonas rapida]
MSESVSINVSGMKCGGCENTINTAVAAIEGVVSVKASHKEKKVDVEFDPGKTDMEAIEDAIIDAGFNVE